MKSTFLALLSSNQSYRPATLFLVHKIMAKINSFFNLFVNMIAGKNGEIPMLFSVVAVKNL